MAGKGYGPGDAQTVATMFPTAIALSAAVSATLLPNATILVDLMTIANTESFGASSHTLNRDGGVDVRTTTQLGRSNYWLYLMTDSDAVKIGISDVPPKRAKQLQTGNPDRLTILATVGFSDKAAAKKVEDEWKWRWKQWATNGGSEWFRPPDEQVDAAINEILASSQLPPKEPRPAIAKWLKERVEAGFKESYELTNTICKRLNLPASVKPYLRGTLLNAFFEMGDNEMHSLQKHIPEIRSIMSSQFDTYKCQLEKEENQNSSGDGAATRHMNPYDRIKHLCERLGDVIPRSGDRRH